MAGDRLGGRPDRPAPPVSDLDSGERLAALTRDKKVRAGCVPFVLPAAIGSVRVCDDVARSGITRVLRVMAGRGPLLG